MSHFDLSLQDVCVGLDECYIYHSIRSPRVQYLETQGYKPKVVII